MNQKTSTLEFLRFYNFRMKNLIFFAGHKVYINRVFMERTDPTGCLATFTTAGPACVSANPTTSVKNGVVRVRTQHVTIGPGIYFYLYGSKLPTGDPTSSTGDFSKFKFSFWRENFTFSG
jgi:hypothetical protein